MERDLDNEYQLAFTRFGVAILLNWDTIFIPSSRSQENRPVLIYDYDAFCYLFCDSSHFLRKQEAWTVFADQFGTEAPPLAEPAPPGKFTPIGDFIALFDRGLDDEGMPIRPRFHNRPASTET